MILDDMASVTSSPLEPPFNTIVSVDRSDTSLVLSVKACKEARLNLHETTVDILNSYTYQVS